MGIPQRCRLVEAMSDAVSFTAHGHPITQGSKTRTRWGMRDDNGELGSEGRYFIIRWEEVDG